jgi:toluene monooxygenase system protein E
MSTSSDLSKPLKTWSHLATARKRPTEYEIVSTKTLWNTPNHSVPWKMAGATPQIQWIIQNRNESLLKHEDWDAFRDPDHLIYRTYTLMQDGQEAYVDGVLNDYNENDYDVGLDPSWVAILAQLYAPARYVFHTVQMASGYLVTLAPCSTVANPMMLQCGDQLRWVNRIAYRTAELARTHDDLGLGVKERELWEKSPFWHGFVELAERALVAWDWGECFTATNLVLKPALDEVFMRQLALCSRRNGDTLTATLLDAQMIDSARARKLSGALVAFLLTQKGNREVFGDWLSKWRPLGEKAIAAYAKGLDADGTAADAAIAGMRAFWEELGLAG